MRKLINIVILSLLLVSVTVGALAEVAKGGLEINFGDYELAVVKSSHSMVQLFINLIGTLWPLIIPAALAMGVRSGLYIFIYRQFFINLPVALEDAAYIDGAGPYRTFFSIMLPNIKNAIITVFLFSFVWNWGEYYLSKQFLGSTNRSIMVSLSTIRRDLSSLSSLAGIQIGSNPEKIATRVMAGCLITAAPMLLMFIFTQRFLADSIEHIGIK